MLCLTKAVVLAVDWLGRADGARVSTRANVPMSFPLHSPTIVSNNANHGICAVILQKERTHRFLLLPLGFIKGYSMSRY